jgi:precorrin-6B methylase 1
MKIRFQADNDFDERVIRALLRLQPAIDFQTATAIGFHLGTPDNQVLARAADEGRVLVSHDIQTMPRHFAAFIVNRNSPGVLIVSQALPIAEAAYLLLLIWEASETEEYINLIYRLPWPTP